MGGRGGRSFLLLGDEDDREEKTGAGVWAEGVVATGCCISTRDMSW
jgi:hypothetical protein